jgi:hypothetical protein
MDTNSVLATRGGIDPRLAIWLWYRLNQEKVVFSAFRGLVKVRVRHLRHIVEEIAGPEPIESILQNQTD